MEIVFQGVTVRRGERAILQDVSGVAHAGEVMAVMGPSGELVHVYVCMCRCV